MECKSIVIDDSEIERIMRCLQKCTSKDRECMRHIHWDPAEKMMVATDAKRMLMWRVGDPILEEFLGQEPSEFDWINQGKMLASSKATPKDFPCWNRVLLAKGKYIELTGMICPITYVAHAAGIVLDTRYEDILKTFKPYGMWFIDGMHPVLFDLGPDLRYMVMPMLSPEPSIFNMEDVPPMEAQTVKATYNFVGGPA